MRSTKGTCFASLGVCLVSALKRGVKFIVWKKGFRSVVLDLDCTSPSKMSAKFEKKNFRTTNGLKWARACWIKSQFFCRHTLDLDKINFHNEPIKCYILSDSWPPARYLPTKKNPSMNPVTRTGRTYLSKLTIPFLIMFQVSSLSLFVFCMQWTTVCISIIKKGRANVNTFQISIILNTKTVLLWKPECYLCLMFKEDNTKLSFWRKSSEGKIKVI